MFANGILGNLFVPGRFHMKLLSRGASHGNIFSKTEVDYPLT